MQSCKRRAARFSKLEDAQGESSKSPNSSENQAKIRRVRIHSTLYDLLPDNFNTDKFVTDFCSFVHEQPKPIQFSQLLPQSTAIMKLSDSEFGSVPEGQFCHISASQNYLMTL